MQPRGIPVALAWRQRLMWMGYAAVPSSLMLGVTTYISTDVAAIPLLWIAPLALYLLTFVLIFGPRPIHLSARVERLGALAVTFVMVAIIVRATQPIGLLSGAHLAVFFVAAMICHQRLANGRPAPQQLTEFYLWMSAGGVLGSAFNTFAAPNLFQRAWEYPLALAIAFSLRVPGEHELRLQAARDAGRLGLLWRYWWLGVACLTVFNIWLIGAFPALPSTPVAMFTLPAIVVFTIVEAPRRFGLALAAMLLVGSGMPTGRGKQLLIQRSFFGTIQVTESAQDDARYMFHGTTLHGVEHPSAQQAGKCIPLSYYARTGPIGRFLGAWGPEHPRARVGVVGLGTGALACYGLPEQAWSFYELDPHVVTIARDAELFTFLKSSPARDQSFYVGDARLRLKEATPYDLLVLDAFSSDAIPIHLLTIEALELYLAKLNQDGVLALHVSSREFKLVPVVATLARATGLEARVATHSVLTAAEVEEQSSPSQWIFLARQADTLDRYNGAMDWTTPTPSGSLWTDSFSNLIETLF